MANAKILFTRSGYDKMVCELADLRAKREPTVQRLQAAREMGDLSENGAYKAARFELSDIDRNIRRLTGLIKCAVVCTPTRSGRVEFGSTVILKKNGAQFTYELVSRYESDPLKNRLSIESPLGLALMGKQQGDFVTITAPAGTMNYQITQIR